MGKRTSVVVDAEVVPNLRERRNADGSLAYDVTRSEYRKLKARTAREAKEELMLLNQAETEELVERLREVVRKELQAWSTRGARVPEIDVDNVSLLEQHVPPARPVLEHASYDSGPRFEVEDAIAPSVQAKTEVDREEWVRRFTERMKQKEEGR